MKSMVDVGLTKNHIANLMGRAAGTLMYMYMYVCM